ncbi:MAG: SEC-C metal-binding domain-containing protein, partial [Bacteroidota bacterium]
NTMFNGLTESLVLDHKAGGDFESFRRDSIGVIGIDPKMDAAYFAEADEMEVVAQYRSQVFEFYQRKSSRIAEVLLPIIRDVYEREGSRYKRIAIPYTDGSNNVLPISADLETAIQSEGKSVMTDIEKAVTLSLIDQEWKEHLRSMDELKESVQAASFEQKDPLVVYKMEAYELFEQLVYRINEKVTSYLLKGTIIFSDGTKLSEAKVQKTDLSRTRTSRTETSDKQAAMARAAAEGVSRNSAKPETFKRTERKVGRNEPCPCGSGKKYKRCHGKE